MNRTAYEAQIQNLRNKRLGRAKPAKKVAEKTPSGSIRLSSPTTFQSQIVTLKSKPAQSSPPAAQKAGGCGCSRGKK